MVMQEYFMILSSLSGIPEEVKTYFLISSSHYTFHTKSKYSYSILSRPSAHRINAMMMMMCPCVDGYLKCLVRARDSLKPARHDAVYIYVCYTFGPESAGVRVHFGIVKRPRRRARERDACHRRPVSSRASITPERSVREIKCALNQMRRLRITRVQQIYYTHYSSIVQQHKMPLIVRALSFNAIASERV